MQVKDRLKEIQDGAAANGKGGQPQAPGGRARQTPAVDSGSTLWNSIGLYALVLVPLAFIYYCCFVASGEGSALKLAD